MRILILLRVFGNPYPVIAEEVDYQGKEEELLLTVAHRMNSMIPHEMWHDIGVLKLEINERAYITRKKK